MDKKKNCKSIGVKREISAEEAESYMESDEEDESTPCCEYNTEWDEQWYSATCA